MFCSFHSTLMYKHYHKTATISRSRKDSDGKYSPRSYPPAMGLCGARRGNVELIMEATCGKTLFAQVFNNCSKDIFPHLFSNWGE